MDYCLRRPTKPRLARKQDSSCFMQALTILIPGG